MPREVSGPPEEPGPLGLTMGEETTREKLAALLHLRGETPLQRGMFKPATGPFTNHLFLFHDPEENPYGDVVGPEIVEYVGQGREGDQRLDSFNRYLAEHLRRNLTVHFFVKEPAGQLRYDGEVICQGYERVYRTDEERSVLRFSLVRVAPLFGLEGQFREPLVEYASARSDVLRHDLAPRLVDRPIRLGRAQRLVRDVAFRDVVLEAYKKTCAVCGPPLARGPLVDLQGAHIVGVAERGPDDPRNGLSLCHRHHWAFDSGIFTLSDDLRLQMRVDQPDPHGEITDGEPILIPSDPRLAPYPGFVEIHRAKWALS